ncbi:hypothetical protein ACFZAV_36750 [Streptomyces sp. NPDC008343]
MPLTPSTSTTVMPSGPAPPPRRPAAPGLRRDVPLPAGQPGARARRR